MNLKNVRSAEFKYFENVQWLKLFYHRPGSNKEVFTSEEEFLSVDTDQKYSILYILNSKFKIKGKYEFLLYYPDTDEYNWWRQTLIPYKDIEVEGVHEAKGYEPVVIQLDDNGWNGLVNSTIKDYNRKVICSYVDGSVGYSEWFYSIGMKCDSELVPGGYSEWDSEVYLYIRVNDVSKVFGEITQFHYQLMHFLSVLLIICFIL